MKRKIFFLTFIFFVKNSFAADCPQATKLLAEAMQSNFNLTQTEENLNKVIVLCPEMPEAYYHLATNQIDQSKLAEAIKNLKKAISLKNEMIFEIALGNAYFLSNNFEEAEKAYNEVLAEDSNSIKAMQGLSAAYLKEDKDAEAEEILRRAIQVSSDDAALFYNLGIVLQKMERFDEAFQSFKAAVERKSPYPAAQINLAQLLFTAGKTEEAEKLFRQASLYEPKNPNIWLGIAAALEAKKDYKMALSNIEKAISLDPTLIEAKINQAIILVKLDRKQEGLEKLIQLKQINPENSKVISSLGWAYLEDKKLDLAAENLETALRLNPKDAFSYNNLGIVMQLKGEHEKARISFEKAKDLKPKFKEVEVNLETLK